MRKRASSSKAAQGWLRLLLGIHPTRSHDCAWYTCRSECWSPSQLSLRPLEQNDMARSAVKRISRCSENWNLTDALEQQGGIILTPPQTTLGAIAVLRYLETLFDDPEANQECTHLPEQIDGKAWPLVFFRTLAAALVQVQQ